MAQKRGFFCDDLSLRYPYRDCTITVPMLVVYMLVLPMLFIGAAELVRIRKCFRPRKYMLELGRSWAVFSAGFIATYLTTELAKHVVGRLRPHFYAACQPRLSNGSAACQLAHSQTSYVEEYYCGNSELDAAQQRELHVSFPSAHSALSFYSMLFLCFYVHAAWRRRGRMRQLRPLLQFLLLLTAWYIALSRVRDYWHHWSDVLAGILLGVAFATLTAVYVGDMLQPPASTSLGNAQQQQKPQQQPQPQPLKEQLMPDEYEWKLQTVLQT